MRRFSLYRRGRIWYAAFYNPTTKRYAGAMSTRETSRNSALLRAAEWDKWGIPELGGRRAVMDTLNIDTILETIRQTELTAKDAARIISALKARDLIEYALMKDAPGAEGLVSFLQRFWNYDESPYVREKLLHHHRIERRHCYDQEINAQTY